MSSRLRLAVAVLFGVAALLLADSYTALRAHLGAAAADQRAQNALTESEGMMRAIYDSEAAARAYLGDHDPAELARYRAAGSLFGVLVADVRLLAPTPDAHRALDATAAAFASWSALAGSAFAAGSVARLDRGRALEGALGDRVQDVMNTQDDALIAGSRALGASMHRARTAGLAGAGLAALAVLILLVASERAAQPGAGRRRGARLASLTTTSRLACVPPAAVPPAPIRAAAVGRRS